MIKAEEELRKIFGQLSGGRLEDVADKLLALFRAPEWWEAEFDAQFVVRGSIGTLQDADQRDAVKAFIRTLLTRVQHEERQQCVRDIERLRETVLAGAGSPEEQRTARHLYAVLLQTLRQQYALAPGTPEGG
jgi:recombinational DNA repair protein RecR